MVRIIKCNSLDLNLFQFDYDLTFSVFFLNADRTVYARYGTRSGQNADDDVAIGGLAATMKEVLRLHAGYPANAKSLASKQPKPSDRDVPESYSSLDHFKPQLDYRGQVAKSCIHCHQVRDAKRLEFRTAGKPMPRKLLYPYPSAHLLGIQFDTQTRSHIRSVGKDSVAAAAGIRKGDQIHSVQGHKIHSEADFGWVLHQLEDSTRELKLHVNRGEHRLPIALPLPEQWRAKTDLSWRPTSWDLRRMATGGMTLVELSLEEREQAGITNDHMALRANHVGMYGHHARAKKAGIRKGDVIVSFDGRNDLLSENMLIDHAVQNRQPGDRVEIVYQRNGKRHTTYLRLQ